MGRSDRQRVRRLCNVASRRIVLLRDINKLSRRLRSSDILWLSQGGSRLRLIGLYGRLGSQNTVWLLHVTKHCWLRYRSHCGLCGWLRHLLLHVDSNVGYRYVSLHLRLHLTSQ